MEKDADVQKALDNLLKSRLAMLKREQMREQLLPLLRHKNADIVLVGLKVVRDSKEKAADVAAEVADLLKGDNAKTVREDALATLKVLGPAADKALPKLFEILAKTRRSQRTPLALTVAVIVDAKDGTNVRRLVPFLLDGLHPNALKVGASSKAAINRVLLKIGQPAVEGSFKVLSDILASNSPDTKDNAHYRMNLYETLAKLGPKCPAQGNHDSLQRLWKTESARKSNTDVTEKARAALNKMDSR